MSVLRDGGNGELFVSLPPELVLYLGLKVGDGLSWTFENGEVYVRRLPRANEIKKAALLGG